MKMLCSLTFCLFLPFLPSLVGDIKTKQQIVEEAKANVTAITVDDLKHHLHDTILIDIRTKDEYVAGHIQGSQWISRGTLEFVIQSIAPEPDAPIVVYCRSGGRSALAANSLQAIGYRKIRNLEGGFKAWVEAAYSAYNVHGEFKVLNFEKPETN